MSDAEMQRVKADLELMRQAAGVDLPFQREDIWWTTAVLCVAGAAIAAMGWWVPNEYRWVALGPTALVLGVWGRLARFAYRKRAATPARWRECRYGLWSLGLLVPLFIAFIVWQVSLGMSRVAVASSAVFFTGLGLAWIALVDRTRRYYIGVALPMLLFACAIPWCGSRATGVGVGLMVIAMALGSAMIQAWQLRCQEGWPDGD